MRNIYRDITGLSGYSENRAGFVYKPSVIRSGGPVWGHRDVEPAYWRRGSVVRALVSDWRTFPYMRLIYG